MPRYRYQCSACKAEATIFHLINETIDECSACRQQGTMVKQLTTPQYKDKTNKSQQIGEVTKEFIEKNKEILNQEKQKRKNYEPT